MTPYQSEDPSLTIPTHRNKARNENRRIMKKERAAQANDKALTLLLKFSSPTPSNTGSERSF